MPEEYHEWCLKNTKEPVIFTIANVLGEEVSDDGCIHTTKYETEEEIYSVIYSQTDIPTMILPFLIYIKKNDDEFIIMGVK